MKTMRLPLSAVEGVLIGESADSAPKEQKMFNVDMSMRSLIGAETVVTAWVPALDAEEAKVAALDMLIALQFRNVEFGEIKEVENEG